MPGISSHFVDAHFLMIFDIAPHLLRILLFGSALFGEINNQPRQSRMVYIFAIQSVKPLDKSIDDDIPPIHSRPNVGMTSEKVDNDPQDLLILVDPQSAYHKVGDTRVPLAEVQDVYDACESRGVHGWCVALPDCE